MQVWLTDLDGAVNEYNRYCAKQLPQQWNASELRLGENRAMMPHRGGFATASAASDRASGAGWRTAEGRNRAKRGYGACSVPCTRARITMQQDSAALPQPSRCSNWQARAGAIPRTHTKNSSRAQLRAKRAGKRGKPFCAGSVLRGEAA